MAEPIAQPSAAEPATARAGRLPCQMVPSTEAPPFTSWSSRQVSSRISVSSLGDVLDVLEAGAGERHPEHGAANRTARSAKEGANHSRGTRHDQAGGKFAAGVDNAGGRNRNFVSAQFAHINLP